MNRRNIFSALGFFILFLLIACTPQATPVFTPSPSVTPQPSLTPTPSPTLTPTNTPTPTQTPVPTPMGGGGRLIFVWVSHDAERWSTSARAEKEGYPNKVGYTKQDFPNLRGEMNLFTSSLDGTNPIPLTTDGVDGVIQLLQASPDGKKLLFSSYSTDNTNERNIYVLDLTGSDPQYYKIIRRSGVALWVDNEQIAYLGMYGGVDSILLTTLEDSSPIPLTKDEQAAGIISVGDDGVYWASYKPVMSPIGMGMDITGIWWSSLDGKTQRKISSDASGIVSPDRKLRVNIATWQNIEISYTDEMYFDRIHLPAFIDEQWGRWSPDSLKVFFPTTNSQLPAGYIFDAYDCSLYKLPDPHPVMAGTTERAPKAIWSPDGKRLILLSEIIAPGSPWSSAPISKIARIFDLETKTYVMHLPEEGILSIISILWLPDPNNPQPDLPRMEPSSSACTYRSRHPDQVSVAADKQWRDTQRIVNPGDVVTINYKSGHWGWEGNSDLDANGDPKLTGAAWDICTNGKDCMVDAPLGGLIGKIGEKGKFFFVGNELIFTVPADTPKEQNLFLMVNDTVMGLRDNVGVINVEITIQKK
jgi:hypothetical protein